MANNGVHAPASLVGVTIDAIGLSRELVYSVPEELSGAVGAGTPVIVSVQGRKRRGWVTHIAPEKTPERILELSGLDDYPLPPELFELCRAAAYRYASSEVHFFKHARSAAHALPASLLGPSSSEPGFSLRYLRLSPCDSSVATVAEMARAARSANLRSLVLVGSEIEAGAIAKGMNATGITAVVLTRALPKYKREAHVEADCVVATRLGAFAPLDRLGLIVVVDPEDKAHRNQGEPTWRSAVVAAERARLGNFAAVMVSGYPSPESAHRTKLMRPRQELECWPQVEVVELEGRPASLTTPELADWVRSLMPEATPQAPVVLLLNRKGKVNRYACRKCRSPLSCERCGSMLVAGPPYAEAGVEAPSEVLHHYVFSTEAARRGFEKLFARGLICPSCSLTTPAACGHCKSTSISPVSVGTGRIADELEASIGLSAEVIDESTAAGVAPAGGLAVATEAALTRLSAAVGVAFVDFDQYHFSSGFGATNRIFRAWYKASVLINQGSGSAPVPRLLLQTRDSGSLVVSQIVARDPAGLLGADIAERRRLDLPPFSALAVLRSDDALAYAERLAPLASKAGGRASAAEILPLSETNLLIKAPDHEALLACLSLRSEVGMPALVHVDPEEL